MDDNTPKAELPKYRSHKEVHALKIAKIEVTPASEERGYVEGWKITPADEGYGPVYTNAMWVGKHNPKPGGYLVIYEDGYRSFSPAEAFESGYTRI